MRFNAGIWSFLERRFLALTDTFTLFVLLNTYNKPFGFNTGEGGAAMLSASALLVKASDTE